MRATTPSLLLRVGLVLFITLRMYILCLSSLCSHLQAMCLCACLASPHACFYRLRCDAMPSTGEVRRLVSCQAAAQSAPRSALHRRASAEVKYLRPSRALCLYGLMERAQLGSNGDISVVTCHHRRPVTGTEATGIAISLDCGVRCGRRFRLQSSVPYLVPYVYQCSVHDFMFRLRTSGCLASV